ncbi:MAG: hypothetical protein QM698_05535 [Micropepsaceae bacterium]
MRALGLAIFSLLSAGGAAAAEPPVVGEVSLRELQAVVAPEASYALDERWSVDVARDAGAPAEAYVPGTAIDAARPRSRLVLSLSLAHPEARLRPYLGAGVEEAEFERFGPARPYQTGGNDLANFAATVVGGFDMDAGEGWSLKFKADTKKVGLGMKLELN